MREFRTLAGFMHALKFQNLALLWAARLNSNRSLQVFIVITVLAAEGRMQPIYLPSILKLPLRFKHFNKYRAYFQSTKNTLNIDSFVHMVKG